MAPSLFRRVTRYRVSPTQNPLENRLTEVTAAVLENADFAADFASALLNAGCEDADRRLKMAPPDQVDEHKAEAERRHELRTALAAMSTPRVRVRTQVPTTSKHFVDLELLLRPPLGTIGDDMLFWVEVKHGADLSGDQLDFYLVDIESSDAAHKAVILLAPRDTMPAVGREHLSVPRVEWQSVSRVAAASAKETLVTERAWLLRQYSAYLKEEGLMDPEALTAAHALALLEHDAAAAAVAGICEQGDAYVQKHWSDRGSFQQTRKGDPRYGLGYWANYSPYRRGDTAAERWGGGWFEWGLRDTAGMEYLTEEKRGSFAFTAGVTLHAKSNPARVEANQQWLSERRADGFTYFWHGGYYRVCKPRYPDELLATTSLEEQGTALGKWAVESFEALADNPPPA